MINSIEDANKFTRDLGNKLIECSDLCLDAGLNKYASLFCLLHGFLLSDPIEMEAATVALFSVLEHFHPEYKSPIA